MAARFTRNEGEEHTLQRTALVNEVYLKLGDVQKVDWKTKTHSSARSESDAER